MTEENLKDVRIANKCPCFESDIVNGCGKFDNNWTGNLKHGLKKVGELTKQENQNHCECSWIAFFDPLMLAVMDLKRKKEHGIAIDEKTTPNIVLEGFMYYEQCFNNIQNFLLLKRLEKAEQERKRLARQ